MKKPVEREDKTGGEGMGCGQFGYRYGTDRYTGVIGVGRLGGTTASREDYPYGRKHIGDFNRRFCGRFDDDYLNTGW